MPKSSCFRMVSRDPVQLQATNEQDLKTHLSDLGKCNNLESIVPRSPPLHLGPSACVKGLHTFHTLQV